MKPRFRVLPGFAILLLVGSLLDAASGLAAEAHGPRSAAAMSMWPGSLTVLPEDGRELYLRAIDAARKTIKIEICVLEDPQILQRIQTALGRGVSVRVIVDHTKYDNLASERDNLAQYLTAAGGELHLSNPMFPRSFPKIILIDSYLAIYGSACLDQTTFAQYRDFAHTSANLVLLRELHRLFDNDWAHSAPAGQEPPPFNPTPRMLGLDLIVSPFNGAELLTRLYQSAQRTLDVYTELLGNRALESELVAAVARGVRVRLIAPICVNGGSPDVQDTQLASLTALAAAGVEVHVSGPEESADFPYMHARAAVVDGATAYLGSLSLSPDSATLNREMGLIVRDAGFAQQLQGQFESDYQTKTRAF